MEGMTAAELLVNLLAVAIMGALAWKAINREEHTK